MTPEEKAKELVKKFLPWVSMGNTEHRKQKMEAKAKQCAIICVEEIIDLVDKMPMQDATRAYRIEKYNYWQQVLNHLK